MKEKAELLIDLRSLRQQAGLSADYVAEISGIGSSTYSRLEAGAIPNLESALRMARLLRMPVEEIWGLPKEAKQKSGASGVGGASGVNG